MNQEETDLGKEFLKGLVGEKGNAAIVGVTEEGKTVMFTHGHPVLVYGVLDFLKRVLWVRCQHQEKESSLQQRERELDVIEAAWELATFLDDEIGMDKLPLTNLWQKLSEIGIQRGGD